MIEVQSKVKERPILFSGAMVRALLAGTKTQTRREMKPQPQPWERGKWAYPANRKYLTVESGTFVLCDNPSDSSLIKIQCPYGQPGDRLWVRETFGLAQPDGDDDFEDYFNTPENKIPKKLPKGWQWTYRADRHWTDDASVIWKPSIHMPRAASRLLLEITAVRVERVRDISNEDAIAEGCRSDYWSVFDWKYPKAVAIPPDGSTTIPRSNYASLWQEINGPESWAANPWVWVVEFKVVTE